MERASKLKRKKSSKRAIKEYTVLRCPMVGHQASWCRHLCKPTQGKGLCGRTATHHMKDKFQIAIARHRKNHQNTSEERDE